MTVSLGLDELGDTELVQAVRERGDTLAYGRLWERHRDAAVRLAVVLMRNRHDAQDVVSEAAERVLKILLAGGGPTGAFRPYLLMSVRNICMNRFERAKRESSEDDLEPFMAAVFPTDAAVGEFERGAVTRAFRSLPERWQTVLWHTVVEDEPLARVAEALGIKANAVAALAFRAREGLRRAYLAEHIKDGVAGDCAAIRPKLVARVRGASGKSEAAAVDQHVANCADCAQLADEVREVNGQMRAVLVPALLGGAAVAAQYLRTSGASKYLLAARMSWTEAGVAPARLPWLLGVLATISTVLLLGVYPGEPMSSTPPGSPPSGSALPGDPLRTPPAVAAEPGSPFVVPAAEKHADLRPGRIGVVVQKLVHKGDPDASVLFTLALEGATVQDVRDVAVSGDRAWRCRLGEPAVRCTAAGAVPGDSTFLVRLRVDGTATGVRITATASSPGQLSAERVTRLPVTPSPSAASALYADIARGEVHTVGNGSLTCDRADSRCGAALAGDAVPEGTALPMVHRRDVVDTTNSSQADLVLSPDERVVWAGLFWAASAAPPGAPVERVRFGGPEDVLRVIAAEQADVSRSGNAFSAYRDVTDLVSAGGRVTVADVHSATGTGVSAGWMLHVVTSRAGAPVREMTVLDVHRVAQPSAEVALPWLVSVTSPRIGLALWETQPIGRSGGGWSVAGWPLSWHEDFLKDRPPAAVPAGTRGFGTTRLWAELPGLPMQNGDKLRFEHAGFASATVHIGPLVLEGTP
ncbi:sigma-70 family RNA polymerase sigma factor [Lentzea sp. E54]|uniref:sigma-70 family RNA polymerase sigma factor n=1 Tax=Lentzea xerophila TaxID=3435883 RepID=UPI003DA39B4A